MFCHVIRISSIFALKSWFWHLFQEHDTTLDGDIMNISNILKRPDDLKNDYYAHEDNWNLDQESDDHEG